MKQSLFTPHRLLTILFSHQKLSKICLMVGFGLFVGTLIFYVLGLTTIFTMLKFPSDSFHYHKLLMIMAIFLALALILGFHASAWLIFAFSGQKRLVKNRKILKTICLISGNGIGYYGLDYLIENYWDSDQTFSAVLLTNEHVLDKRNKIGQACLIVCTMFSIIIFLPMIFLTCGILSESHYVYYEESEIRDRISLTLESLFCLFPVFSLTNLIANSRNGLFVAGLAEIFETDKISASKTYGSHGLNILIWIVYYLAIVALLFWFSSMMTFILTDFSRLNPNNNFLILFVGPIISVLVLFFSVYKKCLYEGDKKVPLGVLVLEILTLNLLMMAISLIFIYRNYHESQNEHRRGKAELDKKFFGIISVNTVLTYILVILSVVVIGFNHSQAIPVYTYTMKTYWFIIVSAALILDLGLNVGKMTNYKIYLNNLTWGFLIDCLTLNFLGLIVNLMARNKKNQLVEKMIGFP